MTVNPPAVTTVSPKRTLDVIGVAVALNFEVAEAAVEQDFGVAVGAVGKPAQHGQRDRALGRKPGHAAVFKLDLGTAVVAGIDAGALKQRSVGHGLIGHWLRCPGKDGLPRRRCSSARHEPARNWLSSVVLRAQRSEPAAKLRKPRPPVPEIRLSPGMILSSLASWGPPLPTTKYLLLYLVPNIYKTLKPGEKSRFASPLPVTLRRAPAVPWLFFSPFPALPDSRRGAPGCREWSRSVAPGRRRRLPGRSESPYRDPADRAAAGSPGALPR